MQSLRRTCIGLKPRASTGHLLSVKPSDRPKPSSRASGCGAIYRQWRSCAYDIRTHATTLAGQHGVANVDMDPAVQALVTQLHANNSRAVVYVTGGAVQAISWLLSVPGASNTVLECSVPYARDSLVNILGHEPEQYCVQSTAVAMAKAAYRRAANLTPFGSRILGLGATCALATVPPKRGEHRAYIACHDGARGTFVTSLTLVKGARNRMQEDCLVSMAALQLVARVSGEDVSSFHLPLITTATSQQLLPNAAAQSQQQQQDGGCGVGTAEGVAAGAVDAVAHAHVGVEDPLEALVAGRIKAVEFAGGQVVVDAPRQNRIYLPGSFNPLHKGHVELLHAAKVAVGEHCPQQDAAFELSIGNPDKGMLPVAEIRRRVQQFIDADLPVVVTMAPLFTIKAGLMPGSVFVVGWDTAIRLVMPKYYGGSETSMLLEFARLRFQGCSFLVAGRKDPDSGQFMTLEDIQMHEGLRDLFRGLSEDHFRVDLSSTELRRMSGAGSAGPGSPRATAAATASAAHDPALITVADLSRSASSNDLNSHH